MPKHTPKRLPKSVIWPSLSKVKIRNWWKELNALTNWKGNLLSRRRFLGGCLPEWIDREKTLGFKLWFQKCILNSVKQSRSQRRRKWLLTCPWLMLFWTSLRISRVTQNWNTKLKNWLLCTLSCSKEWLRMMLKFNKCKCSILNSCKSFKTR
jgi:hypothetical protein